MTILALFVAIGLACCLSPAHAFAAKASASPFNSFFDSLKQSLNIPSLSGGGDLSAPAAAKLASAAKIQLMADINQKITENKAVLLEAVETRTTDPELVFAALSELEKLQRQRNKEDEGVTSAETFEGLNGSWRLIFTTGTADSQKKLGGKINYFPIKAVQSFDTSTLTVRNGIYAGNFALVKFKGPFEWLDKPRKLEFDFDSIQVLGIGPFNLPKGKAAEIGGASGLGSDNNKELINKGKKPFFNWISADDQLATARGGGGGLALWQREDEPTDPA